MATSTNGRNRIYLFAAVVLILAVLLLFAPYNMNAMFARFFRNISRYKARRRIYGNDQALIPILLGTEDQVVDFSSNSDDGFTMTLAQLAEICTR